MCGPRTVPSHACRHSTSHAWASPWLSTSGDRCVSHSHERSYTAPTVDAKPHGDEAQRRSDEEALLYRPPL
eukprot:1949816-Prymnesium_polylepis.1